MHFTLEPSFGTVANVSPGIVINPDLARSIRGVGEVMASARDPWWIISSAAVALHGVDAGRVADVDVLLSIDDAEQIFPSLGLPLAPGLDHPDFRSSLFATWTQPPLAVEFMAGFRYRAGDAWLPVQPRTREAISVGNVTVHVPDREELARILRGFGRSKDIERADRLMAERRYPAHPSPS